MSPWDPWSPWAMGPMGSMIPWDMGLWSHEADGTRGPASGRVGQLPLRGNPFSRI